MWSLPGQFDGIAERMRSRFAAWSGAELIVVEGAHRGARVTLGRDPMQIGADLGDDVVLFADGLAPGHVEVALVGALGLSLKVVAHAEAVEVEGVGRIAPGFEAVLPLPARISLGKARIEARSRSPLSAAGAQTHMLSAAFVMAAVLAGGLAAFAASDWTGEAVADDAPPSASLAAPPHADETRLRNLVETAGLAGMVKVETGADGASVLSGRLEGERATAAWRQLLVALDAEPGARRVVNLVAVDRDAAKPPPVGSVWRDGRPRVIFSDGQRVAVGQRTANGWTVSEIGDGGVTLTSPMGAPYRIATP